MSTVGIKGAKIYQGFSREEIMAEQQRHDKTNRDDPLDLQWATIPVITPTMIPTFPTV